MAHVTHFNQRFISALDLGLSDVTLAAERTSNAVNTAGYSQLTIFVNFSTRSAADNIKVEIDEDFDEAAANYAAYLSQTAATAAGVVTLSDAVYTKAVTAAKKFHINVPINCKQFKLRLSALNGAAGDICSVNLLLGTN